MNTHRGINMKQTTNKKGGNGTRFLLREKRKGYSFYTLLSGVLLIFTFASLTQRKTGLSIRSVTHSKSTKNWGKQKIYKQQGSD